MTLDPGDRNRLTRIEAGLAETDPALVDRFRRWKPSAVPALPDWSVLPEWALMVFLVGFTTWVSGPVIGIAVGMIYGARVVLSRRRRRGEGADGVAGRRRPGTIA